MSFLLRKEISAEHKVPKETTPNFQKGQEATGGGSGLAEAQRYPEDYDGIIAGAFGSDWTGVSAAYVFEAQAALNDQASNLSAPKLTVLNSAVVAACDAQDGVTDGIINNPRQCHFDPSVLQCTAGDPLIASQRNR